MRSSEEVLGHVEELRHQEGDLKQQLAAAEALFALARQEELALEGQVERPGRKAAARVRESSPEVLRLKRELEQLRKVAKELLEEQKAMESRLRGLREKAAEDLERAVPSVEPKWETSLDGPVLKLLGLAFTF